MKILVRSPIFALLFLGIFAAPVSAASHVNLLYLDFGNDVPQPGLVDVVVSDSSSNLFNVTFVTKISGSSSVRVIKTDPQGNFLATLDLDIGDPFLNGVTAAAADPQGDLILTGFTGAPGFPLVSPLFPSLTGNGAFVMKLDSNLKGIVFSTLLANQSMVGAVTTDASGNIYVGGATTSSIFPITPNAYQTKPPPAGSGIGGQATYAFLTEISPGGDRLLYSTYFGGDGFDCPFDPSVCIGAAASTGVSALAIAPSGAIVMAGSSSATDLPVAPVARNSCISTTASPMAYVAKFAPGGETLAWGACLSATQIFVDYQPPVQLNAIALDAAGNVIVAGSATAGAFPTTAATIQPVSPQISPFLAGFIAKVNSTGASLLWSTYFGGGYSPGVRSLAVDSQGAVTVAGYSDPAVLPPFASVPLLGGTFVARLSSDGSTVENLYVGPNYATGYAVVLTQTGTFIAEGQSGCLWIESQDAGPSLLGTANAASGLVSNLVSPSELISLYGIGIGPTAAISGRVENGAFTSSLGGYQVLFDDIPAPLLYAGPTQINTIVPIEVAGQDSTRLQIIGPSVTVYGPTLQLRPSQPDIFLNSQTGLAAALNQDGSLNSPQNPAMPGSIVSIFSTGNGILGSDGQILMQASSGLSLPAAILASGLEESLEVLYAGNAPGLVAGVYQTNFRLPNPLPSGNTFEFELLVGDAISQGASIAVSQ